MQNYALTLIISTFTIKTINVKPFGFQEYRLIHEVIVGLTKEGAKGELV